MAAAVPARKPALQLRNFWSTARSGAKEFSESNGIARTEAAEVAPRRRAGLRLRPRRASCASDLARPCNSSECGGAVQPCVRIGLFDKHSVHAAADGFSRAPGVVGLAHPSDRGRARSHRRGGCWPSCFSASSSSCCRSCSSARRSITSFPACGTGTTDQWREPDIIEGEYRVVDPSRIEIEPAGSTGRNPSYCAVAQRRQQLGGELRQRVVARAHDDDAVAGSCEREQLVAARGAIGKRVRGAASRAARRARCPRRHAAVDGAAVIDRLGHDQHVVRRADSPRSSR